MVAAGRGVFLAPELVFGGRSAGVRVHVLDGLKGEFEVLLRRRKGPEAAATVPAVAVPMKLRLFISLHAITRAG